MTKFSILKLTPLTAHSAHCAHPIGRVNIPQETFIAVLKTN